TAAGLAGQGARRLHHAPHELIASAGLSLREPMRPAAHRWVESTRPAAPPLQPAASRWLASAHPAAPPVQLEAQEHRSRSASPTRPAATLAHPPAIGRSGSREFA